MSVSIIPVFKSLPISLLLRALTDHCAVIDIYPFLGASHVLFAGTV